MIHKVITLALSLIIATSLSVKADFTGKPHDHGDGYSVREYQSAPSSQRKIMRKKNITNNDLASYKKVSKKRDKKMKKKLSKEEYEILNKQMKNLQRTHNKAH